MQRLVPTVLTIGAAALPLHSAAAVQRPSEPAGRRSEPGDVETPTPAMKVTASAPNDALRIAIDPRIEDAEYVDGWIREAVADELSMLAPRPERTQWIELEVAGLTYRFELRVTAIRDGVPVTAQTPTTRCECTNEQMLERVREEVAVAVARLNAPIERPHGEGRTPLRPSQGVKAPGVRRYRPTRLGRAGFVLTGLGSASLIGGLIMVTRPPVAVERPEYLTRDWTAPGVGFTAGGAVALVGGAAMWVVDVARCRRRRICGRGVRRGRVAAGLAPSWRYPGAGIIGRFW